MDASEKDLSKHFLTPRNDVEVSELQEKLLDAAFCNSEVTNIAVTGPLGSGKSSLVKSYEQKSGKEFAYISLAEFSFKESDDLQRAENKSVTYLLERKVIDQLSARKDIEGAIKWDKTAYPSSRANKNRRALSMAIAGSVFLAAIVLVICIQAMQYTEMLGIPLWLPFAIALAVPLLLVVAIGFWYGKSGCPPILKSVSVEGASAELESDTKGGSFFDEHLSFIIELFDVRSEEAFVFEDLDRLSNEELFAQLRELNATLNKAVCSKDRPVRFIYCLGDDVLLGEDRTKFFDLMVPVVPVLDGYNSYGTLLDQLGEKADELEEKFLRNIALYVDDYRLLKATVTDYLVYSDVLDAETRESLNARKLFSMAVVKNIAPSVFLDLQRKRGELYEFLSNPSAEEDGAEKDAMRVSVEQIDKWVGIEEPNPERRSRAARLLAYLIESKSIDEGFFFYFARPDEKGLTDNDRSWLLNARNEKMLYEHPINNPETVCTFLHDYEYGKPSRLNLDIVSWVIENTDPESSEIVNIAECTSGKAKDFAALAIERIPKFAYTISRVRADYLSGVDEAQRGLFALSVIGGAGGSDELTQIDDANGGLLKQVVAASAGMYTSADIDCFKEVYPSIVDDVIWALDVFGQKANRLSDTSCAELTSRMVEEGCYVQSDGNCRIALGIDVKDLGEFGYVCDLLALHKESHAWKNIAKDPDRFVDEHLGDTEKLVCSEASLLDLLNLKLSFHARSRLLEAYTGEVASLASITDKTCWDAALEHKTVACSYGNAMAYLDMFGATPKWIKFMNDASNLEGLVTHADETDKQLIARHVLGARELSVQRYEDLVELLDKRSITDIPGNLGNDKLKALFLRNVPAISRNSLSMMRSAFEGGYCLSYISGDIAGYADAIRGSSGIDDEIAAVLELDQVQEPVLREQLVNSLRLAIPITSKHTDETVALLIEKNMIDDSSRVDALKRYGRNKELDAKLAKYAASSKIDVLIAADASTNLLVAAIPYCSEHMRREILKMASTRDWSELEPLLHAFDSEELDAIAQGKRPAINDLAPEPQGIVRILASAGRASIGSDGRVSIRKTVRKK